MADALDRGRASFDRKAWREAYEQLALADRESPLAPDNLERLAIAAFLAGRDDSSADCWTRLHQEFLSQGEIVRAARSAFWLGFELMANSEMAPALGWFARARRLLDEGQHDCVEHGLLLVPVALQSLFSGDAAGAADTFLQASAIGDRFDDPALKTLARLGRGQSLIALGRVAAGVSLLDEAMVAVSADEVSPIVGGLVYCAVIETCHEIFDLRRAQEWTAALSHWCASQPDLVMYRGQCLVRRAEIMQIHGEWSEAMREAQHARDRLSAPAPHPALGAALYVQGELLRLRGDFPEAERAYRQASEWLEPQPGMAQLRLAQGELEAAHAAMCRVMVEAHDARIRSRLLPAFIEIAVAANDTPAARIAATELAKIANDFDSPLLRASSDQAEGAVFLAEGDARSAVAVLRRAWKGWQSLKAPYEAARVRVLIARACRRLGDEDSAGIELDAARQLFERLGALPDLAMVDELTRVPAQNSPGRLTPREVEVLSLVATGKTNRSIANDLSLSEKTVARHVSNIFTKLGLSSRAAATAYAYQHRLV